MIENQIRPFSTRSLPALAAQLLGVAIAAAVVFHGAWKFGFSQDDFWWLAEARGLVPQTVGPWRLVSFQLYFQAMSGVAGLDPLPWRMAGLAAHIGSSFLLFALLRRFVSAPAAWLATVSFAVHPALFTALYWSSAIADVLACGFALGTVIAAGASGKRRLLAVPFFLLALLSKESTILLPFWIAVLGPRPARGGAADGDGAGEPYPLHRRLTDPVVLALCAIAAAYAAVLLRMDVFGALHAEARQAYALHFGSGIAHNLLTYLGWTANFLLATVRGFEDSVDPAVYPWGVTALAAWLAGLASPGLRARGWIPAGALFLTLLAPVLPLENHTYHYYLYAPLAGAAWCIATAFDVGVERIGRVRRIAARRTPARNAPRGRTGAGGLGVSGAAGPWAAAVGVAALLAWNGATLVRKIETRPSLHPRLRADPTVDRALIVRNALDDLARSHLPEGTRLLFWFPRALAPGELGGPNLARETYWEENVRSALADGIAVRLSFPGLKEARFVEAMRPGQPGDLYAVYRIDGHLDVLTGAALDSLVRIMPGSR